MPQANLRIFRRAQTTQTLLSALRGHRANLLDTAREEIDRVAGMLEIAGTVHRLQGGISNNFGYLGIMVAVLARGSALGVLAGAALMAVILNSGIILQTQGVNTSTVLAITGLILFFTAIGDELAHYRIVRAQLATA